MKTTTTLKPLLVGALMGCSFSAGADATAATNAANSATCDPVTPFYWEIGSSSGSPVVSGQVGGSTFSRTTTMSIASASKWVFGTYVVERYDGIPSGALGTEIVEGLGMQTGYIDFNPLLCAFTTKVGPCHTIGQNDNVTAGAVGSFFYTGGDGQAAAADSGGLNLGGLNKSQMIAEINSELDLGPSFSYGTPNVSGGMKANAADYAEFLQRIMDGTYVMHDYLDYSPFATQPCETGYDGCSPGGTVDLHYSLYHWIEDHTGGTLPNDVELGAGDGSFSSAGAFGFYPWITEDQAYYGIIATDSASPSDSMVCGMAIRAAFLD